MAKVKATDPIKFDDKLYAPGDEIDGLTNAQADELVSYHSAEILERDPEPKGRPKAK